MDWKDIKVFLAIAKNGSALGAARELNINPSTVTRRINSFEETLQVRLFDRLPTGYIPTPAGEDLLTTSTQIRDTMLSLERRITGADQELKGKVTLALPLGAAQALKEDIAAFLIENPDLELTIIEGMDFVDLAKGEADVAVRLTRDPHPTLVGRKVHEVAGTLYATADYLASVDDESGVRFIGPSSSPSSPARLMDCYGKARVVARSDSPLTRRDLAEAGVGIAWLPCFLGDVSSSLVRVFRDQPLDTIAMWVLTHPDLKKTRRVEALLKLLGDVARRHGDLLAGRGAGL